MQGHYGASPACNLDLPTMYGVHYNGLQAILSQTSLYPNIPIYIF